MLEGNDGAYVVSALGSVGTGKSSLLNAITGEYTFETGDGTDVKPPPPFFFVLDMKVQLFF